MSYCEPAEIQAKWIAHATNQIPADTKMCAVENQFYVGNLLIRLGNSKFIFIHYIVGFHINAMFNVT